MKTKIGVLGCCVSRDSFNSRIVHNYKDFFKVQISAQRTALISIFQDPVIFDEKDIEILPLNFANKATTQFISEDLNKKFIEDLDEKEIDFLVIDTFIDVTMGILFFNNQIISKAWDFEKTNFFNNIPDKLIFNIFKYPQEYFCIWSKYCDLFFKYLEIYHPNIKVVLNKARLVDKILKSDETINVNPEFTKRAELINPYLDKLDNYIEKNFDVFVIKFDYENTYLNENHIWGLQPVHYQDSFYYSFIEELKKIVNEKSTSQKKRNSNFNELDENYFKKELIRANFETKLLLENLKKKNLPENLKIYNTGRVDVKNFGSKDNKLIVIESNIPLAENNFPDWFKNDDGEGLVILNHNSPINLKIKCINDGILRIYLRGPDVRDKNRNRFPVYIDFTDFRVNNEVILNNNHLVWHDTPLIFEKNVKNLEIINIHVEWLPFNYLSTYENNQN